jgi:hypothetical protein
MARVVNDKEGIICILKDEFSQVELYQKLRRFSIMRSIWWIQNSIENGKSVFSKNLVQFSDLIPISVALQRSDLKMLPLLLYRDDSV